MITEVISLLIDILYGYKSFIQIYIWNQNRMLIFLHQI